MCFIIVNNLDKIEPQTVCNIPTDCINSQEYVSVSWEGI